MFVRGDVTVRMTNEFNARFLAGDTMFIVPIQKITRELRFTCLIPAFSTINTLNTILVTPELWTISMTDADATAFTADGLVAMKGYLKSVDYKLNGVEYDCELRFAVSK